MCSTQATRPTQLVIENDEIGIKTVVTSIILYDLVFGGTHTVIGKKGSDNLAFVENYSLFTTGFLAILLESKPGNYIQFMQVQSCHEFWKLNEIIKMLFGRWTI